MSPCYPTRSSRSGRAWSLTIRWSVDGSITSGGRSAHDLTPLVRREAWSVGRQAWGVERKSSGQWPVNAKQGDRATGEKRPEQSQFACDVSNVNHWHVVT